MPVQPFGGDLVISNKIVYTLTFWPDNLTYSGAVSPMVCKSACKQLFQHHLYMRNTWNHLCVRVDEECTQRDDYFKEARVNARDKKKV